ncbi:MAG: organic hydroperoxide resistance protein [Chloroherpetonaceae bacterium]
MKKEKLYTAVVTVTGGRNGHAVSSDNILDIEMRMPKSLGGKSDDYTNPEQLFAAGYAACFGSSLDMVLESEKVKTGVTTIEASVSLLKNEPVGFKLDVQLKVNIPGIPLEKAKELALKAHQVCPYSNATRNNIDVEIIASNKD